MIVQRLANYFLATIVDVLLSSQTSTNEALVTFHASNKMAIQSLISLPLDVFSKKERERIMKAWLPSNSKHVTNVLYESTALDPQLLALKVKILHRPSLYEVRNPGAVWMLTC